MKRFPWDRSRDPLQPESTRDGTGTAAIHSLDSIGRCLERAALELQEAADASHWSPSADDQSLVDDFAEFLSPESSEGALGRLPDRDFQERLRRRLWHLHLATRLRHGQRQH